MVCSTKATNLTTRPYIWLISACLLVSSCELINPDEPEPAFLHIESIEFTSDVNTEGFPSSKFTDAWVYVENDLIGVFELPADIPVIAEGESEIIIFAGIKDDGISSTRQRYALVESYNATRTLIPGERDTLYPSVTYSNFNTFAILERFEVGNIFSTTSLSEADMIITSNPPEVFEGSRSAKIELTASENYFEAESETYNLPGGGTAVYLELDYRCNQPFDLWISFNASGSTISSYVLTMGSQEEWNKIYINLTDEASATVNATNFRVVFKALKSTTVETGEIYLDNIKLIHL
jgi:hypothetical protein